MLEVQIQFWQFNTRSCSVHTIMFLLFIFMILSRLVQLNFFPCIHQRPAETVDEEENEALEHKALNQRQYATMNGENGEAINGMEKGKEKQNDHYEDELQGQNLDQTGQESNDHMHGNTNEENGEEMDPSSHPEETKEGIDDQIQVTCLCLLCTCVKMLPFVCYSNRLVCNQSTLSLVLQF